MHTKLSICLIVFSGVILTGCRLKTEGTLEIGGKVVDEQTRALIPGREIIIQGIVEEEDKSVPAEAGHFTADSSGYFSFSLKKIRDAYCYNFNLVGDSDYSYKTVKLRLFELEQNAKFLSFSLNKLTALTVNINKTSSLAYTDTLYFSCTSNGTDTRTLYPYKIENLSITDNLCDDIPGLGLRWIGGNINSTVRVRVFADKLSKINWELKRNKSKSIISDTVTCRRGQSHTINFRY
jgi:hypothetical protein